MNNIKKRYRKEKEELTSRAITHKTNKSRVILWICGKIEMVKKAVITIALVEESRERNNEEIEKEIFEEISKGLPKIPWCKKVKKVTVTEV